MSTSPDHRSPVITAASLSENALTVDLSDGRRLSVPLSWFPRLVQGTPAERDDWRLVGDGDGIHWPALDEDVSLAGLLAGRGSGESPTSLHRWTARRGASS